MDLSMPAAMPLLKMKTMIEANRKLQAAQRELDNIRAALDQAAIVAITDNHGDIIHVNDKFCQISKYPREELLGKNHRMINSGYHTKSFFINMWKTISSGKTWEGEVRNRAKDGSYYWVNTTIVPFLDEAGKPYQYVSIRYEITQRKLAEEHLKVYATQLESSNRELQDFASIAAHDLQEPLRKIQAFADRLQTKHRASLADEAIDYLDRMTSSAKRMQTLIDDLLSYSRVSTKGQPFQATDLNQIMADVLSDLEVRIDETHAKIEAQDLPTIDADTSQMRQLFQNLLANSIKFARSGVEPQIQVSCFLTPQICELHFRDNGIGFNEKYLDLIFTIFQRLHGRSEYPGTGVGLAVCRKIVLRHGGNITAKSREGEGAEFIVTLPTQRNKET
jgi:PAS domain S-box-containing protein